MTETIWLAKPKYLLSGPLKKTLLLTPTLHDLTDPLSLSWSFTVSSLLLLRGFYTCSSNSPGNDLYSY